MCVIGCRLSRPTEPKSGGHHAEAEVSMYPTKPAGERRETISRPNEEMYAQFNAWKEKFQENIVDMGGKLKGGGKIVTSEGATDGPFVEAKEVIGGYMIVSADSMEEAMEVARQSPGVAMPGSSVEIREINNP